MYKYVISFLISAGAIQAQAPSVAEEPKGVTTDDTLVVDPATNASAQKAVQLLGNEMLKGNFEYVFNTTYSRQLQRLANKERGGLPAVKQSMLSIPKVMNERGVQVQSYKAKAPSGNFLIWPKIKPEAKRRMDSGAQAVLTPKDFTYHWVMIVPTSQLWQVASPRGGAAQKMIVEGFVIAIAPQTTVGEEKWQFIDGTSIDIPSLKKLFPKLPVNLKLPELELKKVEE